MIDLDAARAARAEARHEHPAIRLGGREYKLTVECTIDAAEAWRENRFRDFVREALLDPAELDGLWAERPSVLDLNEAWAAWRVEPGESSAS